MLKVANIQSHIVKILTFICITTCGISCTVTQPHKESCKMRAYLNTDLEDYISSRFHKGSPVRMAIVPFSVPANLSYASNQQPGLGQQLAWKVHAEMMTSENVPIVEVFNRSDWPGKNQEFFSGNFGALSQAREAGYDLVMVGQVDPPRTTSSLVVHTKIIDVDSGITLWYGTSYANSKITKNFNNSFVNTFIKVKEEPSRTYFNELVDQSATCMVDEITGKNEVYEESEMEKFSTYPGPEDSAMGQMRNEKRQSM